ncbi:MAG: maleylacetate reductase [Corynebacterium casei]|uniref:maleylacetate reductase n=1 Tax=Corynebacterium casei TaxID=160386 RepID=UPI000ECDB215|nr:maleylacetate reductase [Corynebacterium casei]HCJ68487.1 maleylacetate reductase [Corynebacterium casei]
MREFIYQAHPMRVRFGVRAFDVVAEEVEHLGLQRVAVLCTPGRAELGQALARALGSLCVGVIAKAVMHVPREVAAETIAEVQALGADGCVSIGGGSAIGLGKAVAMETGLATIAIPTTYAGSEMTTVWGMTADGHKTTGRNESVLPKSVIYDPELITGLPVETSITSGFNALAHAVEALYAPNSSPIISLMAEEGIRALTSALPGIRANPEALEARSDALYGAWLCGTCLGSTTMSLHHKICHVLGGTLNLPHADTHTVMLPHVLAFNQPAVPEAVTALSRALGSPQGTAITDPARSLWELARELGAPTSLQDLGMKQEDIPPIVRDVLNSSYGNPREVSEESITRIITAAWTGRL